MAKRYELSEAQWERIAPLLPGKVGDPGRSGRANRLFVNGVLWVLRSGARWSDLPERYGRAKSVHKRFTRWSRAGVWERVFGLLAADRTNPYLMIDTSIVRAHARAPTGQKRGASGQALGRSRGGLSTKWHLATDGEGRPLRFVLAPGPASDHGGALPLMAGLSATHVIADKAYDAHLILDAIEQAGAAAVITQRRGWHRPRAFDPVLYRLRNRTERTIGRLKHFRRVATRYDRLPENYLATLHIAAIAVWL